MTADLPLRFTEFELPSNEGLLYTCHTFVATETVADASVVLQVCSDTEIR